jgi:hypothetical protein
MSATMHKDEKDQADFEHESNAGDTVDIKDAGELERNINEPHSIYAEALAKYPNDESIDQIDEKKLKRKLDRRILPLLGICYFFYVRFESFFSIAD